MVKKLAATEEEIAGLHKLISDCHDLKLSTALELAKEYMAAAHFAWQILTR